MVFVGGGGGCYTPHTPVATSLTSPEIKKDKMNTVEPNKQKGMHIDKFMNAHVHGHFSKR